MSQKILLLFAAAMLTLGLSSTLPAEMSIAITSPVNGDVLAPCADYKVTFNITTTGETIKEIRLFSNGVVKGLMRKEPWEYTWKGMQRGHYLLKASVKSTDNVEVFSEPINIKAGPVSNGEKLLNGSFECDTKLTNWTLQLNQGAVATATVIQDAYFDDANYVMFEITNGGTADWHVQFNQPCPTDSGHVYDISFFADADVKKTIAIGMQENQDPYASQLWQNVDIDGADLYGPYEFVATKTDPTNVFRLNVGGNTTSCYFDGFSIIDRSASDVKSKQLDGLGTVVNEFVLSSAYPNPFNMNTAIPFSLMHEVRVRLAVYNMQGQLVRHLLDGLQTPGTHVIHWDGSNDQHQIVPSGVYVYRLESATDRGLPINLMRKVALIK
jgi:hypothetical protein